MSRRSTAPLHSRRVPPLFWGLVTVVALALALVVTVPVWSAVSSASASNADITERQTRADPAAPTLAPSDIPNEAEPPTTPETTSGPTEPDAADDLARLHALDLVDGESIARYYREQFGQAWYDQDRNGCDTRNDILRRDLSDVVFKVGTNDCKVLSGTLIDPYSRETTSFQAGPSTSALIQIDHVVPLAWAWRHGAEHWSFEERMEFANDPANLLAADGKLNQSKSASGPSKWTPPAESAQCGYAQAWVNVLDEWDLGVNAADRSALEATLRRC